MMSGMEFGADRHLRRLKMPTLGLGLRLGLSGSGGVSIPALDLSFITSETLDSRITFTRASSGTRVNSSGLIETITTNNPRFDYSATSIGTALGLLIEEQRTNLFTRSEAIDNAAWGKTQSSITANAATAPDGAATADKLVEDTTGTAEHFAYMPFTFSATSYTFSLFAKAGERSWIQIAASSYGSAFFNLATGDTGTTAGSVTASTVDYGNGWYRCSLTFTGTAASDAVYIKLASANGGNAYTGNGASGAYAWGAQLEAGAFATSYIPTAASQVTRSADVAAMTGSAFSNWYHQAEGTFFVEHDLPAATNADVLSAYDDPVSTTSLLEIYKRSSTTLGAYAYASSAVQANMESQVLSAGFHKTAYAFKADDFAVAVDGGTVVTDSSGLMPSGLIALSIGRYKETTAYMNGHIKRLRYYRSRLPNDTLRSLTA